MRLTVSGGGDRLPSLSGTALQRASLCTWKWFGVMAVVIFFAPQGVRIGWLVVAPSPSTTYWRARELCGERSDLREVPVLEAASFVCGAQLSAFPAVPAAWAAGAMSASEVLIVRMYARAFIGLSFVFSIACAIGVREGDASALKHRSRRGKGPVKRPISCRVIRSRGGVRDPGPARGLEGRP
jgi:hypothetical protein